MPVKETHGVAYDKKSIHIPQDIIRKESANLLLSNLVVTWVGYYDQAYGHYVKRSNLDEYIFKYCVEGSGILEICGKRWQIGKGDVFFCFEGLPHSYWADGDDPWSVYWTHFTGNAVLPLLGNLGISPENPVLHIGDKPKVVSLFNDILDVLTKGYSQCNLVYASTCFQHVLGWLASLRIAPDSYNGEMNVDSVMELMLQKLGETFSLEEFAAHLNLSKYHFARTFKKITGYPPMDYFNRLKIQKACELLDTSSMSIKEISQLLGFGSPYYFSASFKHIVGSSPKVYRSIHWVRGIDQA